MYSRKVIEEYYTDICNLVDILSKLVNSYRLLIGGAGELNSIGLTRKNQIKDAIERSVNLGNLIDDIIETLDKSGCCYLDYCKLKCKFLDSKMIQAYILSELNGKHQCNDNCYKKNDGDKEDKKDNGDKKDKEDNGDEQDNGDDEDNKNDNDNKE